MFKATKLKRLAFFLTFDIAIFAASFYLAYLLRFSGVLPNYFKGGLVAGCATMVVLKGCKNVENTTLLVLNEA